MVTTPASGAGRTGYDPDFLAVRIDPPRAPEPAENCPLLRDTHFTVCLNTPPAAGVVGCLEH